MSEPMSQEEVKNWADERERVRVLCEMSVESQREERQEISEALRDGQWKPDWQTVRRG